jgi:hypothetical protein
MVEERVLSFDGAMAMVLERLSTNAGHAEAIVRRALQSGEVRHERWLPLKSRFAPLPRPRMVEGDFADWLDRNTPKPKPARRKGKVGARAKWDWPAIRAEYFRLKEQNGDYDAEDAPDGWNSKAAAAWTLWERITKNGTRAGPDVKTIERYIGRWENGE